MVPSLGFEAAGLAGVAAAKFLRRAVGGDGERHQHQTTTPWAGPLEHSHLKEKEKLDKRIEKRHSETRPVQQPACIRRAVR